MEPSMRRVAVLFTGGTFNQKADSAISGGNVRVPIQSVLDGITVPDTEFSFHEIATASGKDLTFASILKTSQSADILAAQGYHGVVVLTGTDSLDEFAFALDLIHREHSVPICMTGAARPLHIEGYDGRANFLDAVSVVSCSDASPLRGRGVLVVFAQRIHAGRSVRKYHCGVSADMFVSMPGGPLGEMRRGRPYYYVSPRAVPNSRTTYRIVRDRPLYVPIWTVTVDCALPPSSLLDACDGLVIAGMGTGSVPHTLIRTLAPHTQRMPVVIVSRCVTGPSYDEHYYPGTLDLYEQQGFRVRAYDGLSALQARMRVVAELLCDEVVVAGDEDRGPRAML